MVSDFAVIIAILSMSGLDFYVGISTPKLQVSSLFLYTVYMQIFHTYFFLEFKEEELGCTHYLKQGWYCSASKQNDPVTH